MPTTNSAPEYPPEVLSPLSDVELARQFLARETAKNDKDLEHNTSSTKFERNYKPTPPGRPPAEGPGSLDYNDWEISQLEYFEYDKEEELARLEDEREKLRDRQSELSELQAKLNSNDEEIISQLSRAEKQRLASESQAKFENKQRHEGVQFEGVKEFKKLLEELDNLQKQDVFAKLSGKLTKNGWGSYYSSQQSYHFALNKSKDNLRPHQLLFRFQRNPGFPTYVPGCEFKINLDDLTNLEVEKNSSGSLTTKRPGLDMHFEIKGNRVYGHTKSQVYPRFEFGDYGPVELHVGNEYPLMTQEDFNRAHQILSSLVEDIKASS